MTLPEHTPARARAFSRSHCVLQAHGGARILRGRVRRIEENQVVIGNDSGLHAIRTPSRCEVLPSDIVEVAVAEVEAAATAIEVLVRPQDQRASFLESVRSLDELRAVLDARAAMITGIRQFFLERGFVEVPTPALVPSPGMEPHLVGFSTAYLDPAGHRHRRWLPTSPEFALKRALCAGLDRIFELKTVFRNGEAGPLHSPEFTMLEWYRAFVDYRAIMDDAQELMATVARRLASSLRPFRGVTVRWEPPYPRMSVCEAFRRFAGIDLEEGLQDEAAFRTACRTRLSHTLPDEGFDSLFHRVMMELVEPHLGISSPVILHDYPISMASLAVARRDDPRFCERFEVYAAGVELANAFTEVNDPGEMARRVRRARREQRALGIAPAPADRDLLRAMRGGMPPSAGIAVGVDRLLMAMLGLDHIAAVLPLSMHDAATRDQRIGMIGERG